MLSVPPPMRREAEKSHGRKREIIETKLGNEATMRSHVFRFPNPHFPPSQLAPNTPLIGRNSPPKTAGTIETEHTR